MGRLAGHLLWIAVLTAVTQVGGLAWLVALLVRWRWRLILFPLVYLMLWIGAHAVAPQFGRVALPCGVAEPLRMQSAFYCVALRNFVAPEMKDAAIDAATQVSSAFPGTVTLALDGSFPFFDGFPLLPHLSHDDGGKLDFAFFYADQDGTYLPAETRSPVGYWAFEIIEDETCPPVILTARWGLAWLQPLWPDLPLEPLRTAALTQALLDDPRIGRVFLEPPLATELGIDDERLRFQGCRAARHDDHIHAQLAAP
jgi:hypothetical protein